MYVVTGEKFARLALESLQYLRLVEPTENVTVVVDTAQSDVWIGQDKRLDLEFIELPAPEYRAIDKAKGLQQVKYERFIYLDADTVPIRPFADDMFRALDFCEVLALPGMALNYEWEKTDFSPALSQYNGGVVGFAGRAAKDLPVQWEATYKEQDNPSYDQASLRATILREGYRVGSLPPAFNFRGTGSVREPRVLHFTGQTRKQDWYRSEKNRAKRIQYLATPGLSGRFAGFAKAYSIEDLDKKDGPGRYSWWLAGISRLVARRVQKTARSVLVALRRVGQSRRGPWPQGGSS